MPLTVWTNAQILAQIGTGNYWSGNTITYAFPTTSANLTDQATAAGFSAFSAQQKTMGTLAITLWDDIIAPNLVLTTATNSNIEMANSTDAAMGGGYAYTYFPQDGTAWFNSFYNGTNGGLTNDLMHPVIGQHGFATFIHELGHAFGLDHAGNYNAGVGTPEPTNFQDSVVYSIMSYFGPSWGDGTDSKTGALYSTEIAWAKWDAGFDPQTPMLDDIMVMQSAYGASTTTRTGDTVYGFHSTITGSEAPIYDFTQNLHPIMCLYDSSGNDTLDLSGYNTNSNIDLAPGAFSDTKGMTKNISIAYTAIIENAVGGGGNDTIHGNAVNNTLSGGAGTDSLFGLVGNDTLNGGTGADVISGGGGRDTSVYGVSSIGTTLVHNLNGSWTVTAGTDGTDTLTGVEVLKFTDKTIVIQDPHSDFNADNTSDLLWFQASTGTSQIRDLTNNVVSGSADLGALGTQWVLETSGDFNGDGTSDFMWKNNTTGQFYIWNFTNNVQSGGASLGNIGTAWDVVGSGDFNNDGTGDILWRNATNGQLYIYNMHNDAVASTSSLGILGTDWKAVAVGDFNGDGTADVMLQRQSDGLVYAWDMTNSAVSNGFNFGAIGANWNVMGAGDFNNDGIADLVLRDSNTGQLYLWMLDQQDHVGSTSNLGIIGTAWTVAHVGDANGDGTADLFLKNTTTGQFYIWDIVNGQHTTGADLGTVGTDWNLV